MLKIYWKINLRVPQYKMTNFVWYPNFQLKNVQGPLTYKTSIPHDPGANIAGSKTIHMLASYLYFLFLGSKCSKNAEFFNQCKF